MTRDEMILSLATKVTIMARGMARRYQTDLVSLEDYISDGWLGAIEAVDRYDPGRNCSLNTFAERFILGRMQDALRRADPLVREHRKAVTRGEAPAPIITPLDWLQDWLLGDCRLAERVIAHVDSERYLATLDRRTRRVLQRYYFADRTMREIGIEIGVNESSVSQIIGKCGRDAREARS